MEKIYLTFFCLLFIYILSVKANIGQSCEYDDDCFIDNAFCENQRICKCKRGYMANPERDRCNTMIGSLCDTIHDCHSLANSRCSNDVCDCNPGFVPDARSTNCLPVVTIYKGNCSQDNQCKPSFGDNSYCQLSQCICMQSYHYDNLSRRCFRNTDLGASCHNSSECFIDESSVNKVECNQNNRTCSCKKGYVMSYDNKCSNGAELMKIVSQWLFLIMIGSNVWQKLME